MDATAARLRPRLSRRERQALLYTAAGRTRQEIAALLGVETTSVRTYQERFTAKLGGVNRQHAVSRALLLGEFTQLAMIDTAAVRQPPTEADAPIRSGGIDLDHRACGN